MKIEKRVVRCWSLRSKFMCILFFLLHFKTMHICEYGTCKCTATGVQYIELDKLQWCPHRGSCTSFPLTTDLESL